MGVSQVSEGLRALQGGLLPDMVLCDILMPGNDGHTFHRTLRENPVWRSVPFVYITALDDYHDYRRSMNLGADGYLSKPFSEGELVKEILHVLKRHSDIQQEPPVEITLLGGQSVRRGERLLSAPDRGAEALVFYLLCHSAGFEGGRVSKEKTIEDVWGGMSGSGFRSVLSRAKKWTRGWAHWGVSKETLSLELERRVSCDLYTLRVALRAGVSGRRLSELYRGPLLPAYEETWASLKREALIEEVKESFLRDAHGLPQGKERALSLKRALEVDPFDLELWEDYIGGLHAAGLATEIEHAEKQRERYL